MNWAKGKQMKKEIQLLFSIASMLFPRNGK
jgi:hypothetical protein